MGRMTKEVEIKNIYFVRVGEYLDDTLTPEGVKQMIKVGQVLKHNASCTCNEVNDINDQFYEDWVDEWNITIYHSQLPPAEESARIIAGFFNNQYNMEIKAKIGLNRNARGVRSLVELIGEQEFPWPAIIVAHEKNLYYHLGGGNIYNPWIDHGEYRNTA